MEDSCESLISVECRTDVQVVTLLPKHILDAEPILVIGEALKSLIEQGTTKMVIDFTHVLYLSSGTLGMLVHTKKLIEARQGRLVLSAVKPLVMEIFDITRLGNVFTVYPTADEAVASFNP